MVVCDQQGQKLPFDRTQDSPSPMFLPFRHLVLPVRVSPDPRFVDALVHNVYDVVCTQDMHTGRYAHRQVCTPTNSSETDEPTAFSFVS